MKFNEAKLQIPSEENHYKEWNFILGVLAETRQPKVNNILLGEMKWPNYSQIIVKLFKLHFVLREGAVIFYFILFLFFFQNGRFEWRLNKREK